MSLADHLLHILITKMLIFLSHFLLVSIHSYFSNIDCFCVKQTVFKLLPLRFGGKSMRVFGERSRFLSCDCSRGIKEPLCPYKWDFLASRKISHTKACIHFQSNSLYVRFSLRVILQSLNTSIILSIILHNCIKSKENVTWNSVSRSTFSLRTNSLFYKRITSSEIPVEGEPSIPNIHLPS